MALQKAVKTYPMVKWFLLVAAVLVVVGVVMSKLLTDPNDADANTLLWFLIPAAILPFLAMAFPRREVVSMQLPSDSLVGRSGKELDAMLATLDEAHAKGEMDAARHAKARQRVLAAKKAQR